MAASSNTEVQPIARAVQWADGILPGVMLALAFCFVLRMPPQPGFWGQWICIAVAALWLCLRPWGAARGLPTLSIPLLGIAAVILIQLGLGMIAVPATALVMVALLGLGAAVLQASDDAARQGRGAAVARALAWGVLLALALNAAAVVLGWFGLEVRTWGLARVEPPARALGLIGQSNQLGVLAVLGFFSALYLNRIGRLPAPALFGATLVAGAVCAATASRGALAVWFAAMIFALPWWRGGGVGESRGFRRRLGACAGVFVVTVACWYASTSTGPVPSTAAIDRSDAGRAEMLSDAFALWVRHPVLGIGTGNYAAARLHELEGPSPAPNSDNAHNLLAQALAEWGLAGAAIVVGGVVLVALLLWRRLRDAARTAEEFYAGAWVVGVLAYSVVEHPLWFVHFLLPFSIALGLLAARPGGSGAVRGPAHAASPDMPSWAPRVAALAALAVALGAAAWDYTRLQRLALMMLADIDLPPGAQRTVTFGDVAEVERMTLFPQSARILLSRKLPVGDQAIGAKIVIAQDAMNLVPNGETVARYVLFLTIGGRDDEALKLLERFGRRSPRQYNTGHQLLLEWRGLDPRVGALMANPAVPRPSTGGLTP